MSICQKCGKKSLNKGLLFCPYCGTKYNPNNEKRINKGGFLKGLRDDIANETKKLMDNNEVIRGIANETKKLMDNNEVIRGIANETKKFIDNNDAIGDLANRVNIDDIQTFVDETSKSINEKYNESFNKQNNYLSKAKSYNSKGKYKKSLKYCEKYMELDKSNWEIYYISGDSNFNLKKYKDAIDDFENSLKLKKDNVDVLLPLADSYRLISRNNLAIHHYVLILKIDSENIKALTGEASAFYNLKKYEESISYFNEANQLCELDGETLYIWSQALIKNGNLEEGKCILKKAHESNGRYSSDLKKLDKLILESSKDPETLYDAAYKSFSNKDYKYAIKLLRKALASKREYKSFILIAEAEYYLADYNQALKHCDNALKSTPNSKAYNLKGEILIGLKRYNEAITNFQTGITYDKSANIYSNMGLAYYLLGNHSTANENYFEALSIDSKNSRALIGKALIEESKKNIYAEEVLKNSEKYSLESIFANCLMFGYELNHIYWYTEPHDVWGRKMRLAVDYVKEASAIFKILGIDKDFWLVKMAFDLIYDVLVGYIRGEVTVKDITPRDYMIKLSSIYMDIYGKNEVLCTNHGQIILMSFGGNKDAIKAFDDALSFNPKPINRCRIHSYKGLAYKKDCKSISLRGEKWYLKKSKESFDQSISCYDRILSRNSRNVDVLNEKAHTLILADRKTEAVHCYEEILRIDPNNELAKKGMRRI